MKQLQFIGESIGAVQPQLQRRKGQKPIHRIRPPARHQIGPNPCRCPCIRRYLQLLEPNVQLALLVRMRHEGTKPLLVFFGGYKRADHPTEIIGITIVEHL